MGMPWKVYLLEESIVKEKGKKPETEIVMYTPKKYPLTTCWHSLYMLIMFFHPN